VFIISCHRLDVAEMPLFSDDLLLVLLLMMAGLPFARACVQWLAWLVLRGAVSALDLMWAFLHSEQNLELQELK
jgi:hypothetical protein